MFVLCLYFNAVFVCVFLFVSCVGDSRIEMIFVILIISLHL